jgi:MoaA/NifB/PqqE/SkfB family radical SAM enzyme
MILPDKKSVSSVQPVKTLGSTLRRGFYYAGYGLECFILGKRKPIAAGVPLTDCCNLSCKHCVVKEGNRGHFSYKQICGWIDQFYAAGARVLYLQGGEILLWHDGDKRPNDVIAYVRKRGYFHVAAVTNGTLPIDLQTDALWVSFDGPPKIHDSIRGTGAFDKLRENVSASSHNRIFANFTLNRINAAYVGEMVAEVNRIPNFKGISVNFHTPYIGVEALALSRKERKDCVETLLDLKKAGQRILNSIAGLKALASGMYARPLWTIRLVEQGRMFDCCWGREQPGVCEQCGYGIIAEMASMMRMRPSAIMQAFRLFN